MLGLLSDLLPLLPELRLRRILRHFPIFGLVGRDRRQCRLWHRRDRVEDGPQPCTEQASLEHRRAHGPVLWNRFDHHLDFGCLPHLDRFFHGRGLGCRIGPRGHRGGSDHAHDDPLQDERLRHRSYTGRNL